MAMRWRWPPDKLDAAVADHGREPLRQGFDEIAARRDCRAQHFVVGGGRTAIADVFHDRAMEQRDVLRHHRDRLAQALLRDARNVLAVDGDAAVLHVVEPLQQHEQAGFAAAGLTDQPDPLPRLNTKAEFVEHLQAAGIAERNVVEGDGRACLYQRLGFRVILQFVG